MRWDCPGIKIFWLRDNKILDILIIFDKHLHLLYVNIKRKTILFEFITFNNMQMLCFISFLVILVFGSINSQSSPQGTCQVWGDPHLVMFPVDPAQQGMRMSYWCQSPGRMLILKNKFIEVYVDVTDAPYFNEDVSQIFHFSSRSSLIF